MPFSTIPFYLAIAAYAAAAVLSIRYARGADPRLLFYAKRLAALGNTLLLAVFLLRWVHWGLIPLTGLGDSLNLMLILCTGIILVVQRDEAMRPLLCFYLPALALIALVNGIAGPGYLSEAPRDLDGIPLTIHMGMVFFAFSLFFVASLTSMGYVFKAQRLKRHNTTGLFQRLPSLEQLDRSLFRFISIGYPLFVVTFLYALYWAWISREELDPHWYISPKIAFAVAMAALYGVSFHVRRFGLLRGPKLAYLVFYGFTILLVVYLTLNYADLFTASFSGADT